MRTLDNAVVKFSVRGHPFVSVAQKAAELFAGERGHVLDIRECGETFLEGTEFDHRQCHVTSTVVLVGKTEGGRTTMVVFENPAGIGVTVREYAMAKAIDQRIFDDALKGRFGPVTTFDIGHDWHSVGDEWAMTRTLSMKSAQDDPIMVALLGHDLMDRMNRFVEWTGVESERQRYLFQVSGTKGPFPLAIRLSIRVSPPRLGRPNADVEITNYFAESSAFLATRSEAFVGLPLETGISEKLFIRHGKVPRRMDVGLLKMMKLREVEGDLYLFDRRGKADRESMDFPLAKVSRIIRSEVGNQVSLFATPPWANCCRNLPGDDGSQPLFEYLQVQVDETVSFLRSADLDAVKFADIVGRAAERLLAGERQ